MEDYDALNHEAQIPLKRTIERAPPELEQHVSNAIRQDFEMQNQEQKHLFIRQQHQDQHTIGIKKPQTYEELTIRYTRPSPELKGHTMQKPTDRQEYADDTVLFLESTQPTAILQHLRHYNRITTGRQIPIHWEKRGY